MRCPHDKWLRLGREQGRSRSRHGRSRSRDRSRHRPPTTPSDDEEGLGGYMPRKRQEPPREGGAYMRTFNLSLTSALLSHPG